MSTWDDTRIAELRRLAESRREAEMNVLAEERMLVSMGGWSAPLDDASSALDRIDNALLSFLRGDALLSLLNELESVRRDRDEERERADGQAEAFADVMGALATALDGDDEYYQRPAEVVWKLRNQRDEALQALSDLRAQWLK